MSEIIAPRGIHNFRSITGRTADGREVIPGLVWRSSALLQESDEVAADLAGLGIQTVIDLRDASERRQSPTTNPGSLTWHHIPVFGDQLRGLRWDTLDDLYAIMLNRRGDTLAQAVVTVSESLPAPVLVHCTAGKDRTGVTCALIQEVIGVRRSDVLDDYAQSGVLLGPDYLADLGTVTGWGEMAGEAAHRAVQSPRELLEHVLTRIDEQWGSAAGYLREQGVDEAHLERLRSTLLRPVEGE